MFVYLCKQHASNMSTILSKTPRAEGPTACVAHGFKRLKLGGPFWQAFSKFRDAGHAFLLDSSLATSKHGQYSFIGSRPTAVFQARRIHPQSLPFESVIEIHRFESLCGEKYAGAQIEQLQGDALEPLRDLLAEYAAPFKEEARRRFPFLGGAVGFFGYEAGSWSGPGGSVKSPTETNIPDIYFAIYDRVLCHDNASGETYISVVGRGDTNESAIASGDRAIREIRQKIGETCIVTKQDADHSKSSAEKIQDDSTESGRDSQQRCFDKERYCEAVRTIGEHIEAGDIYQACMTQRFQSDFTKRDPWILYGALRAGNPAPFACYLQTPTFNVVSASPERYLSVDRSGWAESRPIKGTRPRGINPHQDAALRQALIDSEKDRAENVMIVDLVRNDFGRVCRFGSIDVSQLMQIETYATVFQMVSTVRGELSKDRDRFDLVRATFPGGSMTGAPKIEAMKILDRLEPVRRGIYSGGIGYLDYAGAMDLNMVIRSLIIENGVLSYHAGGGVVADSSPEAEYQESLDKVVALQTALEKSRN